MLVALLLILGIFSRLIVHAPNFTPVIALALFSGVYIQNKKYAVLFPLFLMMVSDAVIGFHSTVVFTWASMALTALIGFWLRDHRSIKSTFTTGVFSSVLFFVVTNFGVWLIGDHLYPQTAAGLRDCFMMAIPFFRSTLISTLVFSFLLFGLYEVIAQRVRNTRLAAILLSA